MPNTTQQRCSGGGWKQRVKKYRIEQNDKAKANRIRKAEHAERIKISEGE